MILSLADMFSGAVAVDGTKTGQAVTVTAISTNVIDLRQSSSPALADEGISGPELWLVIQVTVAATAAGAATVVFSVESDSTADLATSATTHFTTAAIGKATLVAGYFAVQTQLPSALTYERYLGVRYTVATGPLTAGNFLAYLTLDVQRIANYASGFTIDV
jgi:hypothetical protein